MGRKAPKPPTEDPGVVAARERQVLDLAKVDEEENRRIKQMRVVSRGVRAFRGLRGTTTAARNAKSGSTSSTAARGNSDPSGMNDLISWSGYAGR